jgi:hypothetical protein
MEASFHQIAPPSNRKFGLTFAAVLVVVGAMFLLIVTPVALVMRAAGRDALRLRSRVGSYWIRRTPPGPPPESFTHQF